MSEVGRFLFRDTEIQNAIDDNWEHTQQCCSLLGEIHSQCFSRIWIEKQAFGLERHVHFGQDPQEGNLLICLIFSLYFDNLSFRLVNPFVPTSWSQCSLKEIQHQLQSKKSFIGKPEQLKWCTNERPQESIWMCWLHPQSQWPKLSEKLCSSQFTYTAKWSLMIRNAVHFIYIENQYFLGSTYVWMINDDVGSWTSTRLLQRFSKTGYLQVLNRLMSTQLKKAASKWW